MYNKKVYSIVSLFFLLWSCSEEDPIKTTALTSSGNEISLDGIWKSDCIDFTSYRLNESFDFENENLVITIHQYSSEACEDPDVTETVTITFQVLETIEAQLNGTTVIANKVKGQQTSSRDNQSGAFKQTFYIDDASGTNILYHGVFGDDGGATSSDGYPMDLHPFAISQE
ncbi:hypothetical protein [Reichenbachiella sp.]|uniref:hypothetical protein n=1 Tax=Reichenbachiella sp. TaxID=2184521 RepID=UPI003B5AC50D